MIQSGSDTATSPVAAFTDVPAPDDAGAQTADRYEWQAMMATADVLAAYFHHLDDAGLFMDGETFRVICELHEDWALLEGGSVELVSAKHREASVSRLATLRSFLECGVLHLFERWQALGGTAMCRLVTTAGVADDAAKMVKACETLRRSSGPLDTTLHDLLVSCGDQIGSMRATGVTPSVELLVPFFASLRVQHGEARRDHLPDMAPTRYARPIAERLGRLEAADAIWGAVLGLVRVRMRAAGPVSGGGLPTVLAVSSNHDPHAARSLTLADVDVAVRVALANVTGYRRLPRLVRVNRLAIKLSEGGCSDNTIERIDSLRLQSRGYWRDSAGTPAIRDRRRRLNNELLKVVADVTEVVRSADSDWGLPLLIGVESRLQLIADGPIAAGLDADLLLGVVGDLSNGCKVWFSDRFDVDAELTRLRSVS
jgi:hypothetical protein